MEKILIVDDDRDILEFLSYNLKTADYLVKTEHLPENAISKALSFKPDLIILDVMMPHIDGIELCELIRNTPKLKEVIIVFLTARYEDYSQVAGYEAGADDYISKPIKPKILISKIKALLKRKKASLIDSSETSIEINESEIQIDREQYLVTQKGKEFLLPKKEFDLLFLLISQPNKVFLRDEIYHQVWGDDSFVGDRTIDVHIRKLRKKFGQHIIQTVKGVGYKFVND